MNKITDLLKDYRRRLDELKTVDAVVPTLKAEVEAFKTKLGDVDPAIILGINNTQKVPPQVRAEIQNFTKAQSRLSIAPEVRASCLDRIAIARRKLRDAVKLALDSAIAKARVKRADLEKAATLKAMETCGGDPVKTKLLVQETMKNADVCVWVEHLRNLRIQITGGDPADFTLFVLGEMERFQAGQPYNRSESAALS